MNIWRSRFGPVQTEVRCPVCDQGHLLIMRSCRQSTCCCPACDRAYTLADLAPRMDAGQFADLEAALSDHLSDRV